VSTIPLLQSDPSLRPRSRCRNHFRSYETRTFLTFSFQFPHTFLKTPSANAIRILRLASPQVLPDGNHDCPGQAPSPLERDGKGTPEPAMISTGLAFTSLVLTLFEPDGPTLSNIRCARKSNGSDPTRRIKFEADNHVGFSTYRRMDCHPSLRTPS